jgi:hypothetical protein
MCTWRKVRYYVPSGGATLDNDDGCVRVTEDVTSVSPCASAVADLRGVVDRNRLQARDEAEVRFVSAPTAKRECIVLERACIMDEEWQEASTAEQSVAGKDGARRTRVRVGHGLS